MLGIGDIVEFFKVWEGCLESFLGSVVGGLIFGEKSIDLAIEKKEFPREGTRMGESLSGEIRSGFDRRRCRVIRLWVDFLFMQGLCDSLLPL